MLHNYIYKFKNVQNVFKCLGFKNSPEDFGWYIKSVGEKNREKFGLVKMVCS